MELVCNECGTVFTGRADARFCSPRCRTRAHRRGHGEVSEPRRRRPLPDAFFDTTYDLQRKLERLERLSEDDRMPRNRELLAKRHTWDLMRAREALDRVIERLGYP